MPIRMKQTVRGSPDGYTVREYAEGTEHALTATPRERELAQVFVREGWAEDLAAKAAPATTEPKKKGK